MAIGVDPRFRAGGAGDQSDRGGSILRYIAAKTPGVDYHPPTGQLGSYGRGPLGEPTFEPFHHTYVDWLMKRTQEEDASAPQRPATVRDFRIKGPASDAGSQAPGSNDQSAMTSRESSPWGAAGLDRNMLIDIADRRSGQSNPWQLNPFESVRVKSFRGVVNRPTRDNIDQISASMFGRDFSPQQRQAIMNYMIAKTSPKDLWALKDVTGDTRSVTMNPAQKQTIDGMIQRLPNDPLGARARQASGQAIKQGFIRVHR
jgi:hypothetical protein